MSGISLKCKNERIRLMHWMRYLSVRRKIIHKPQWRVNFDKCRPQNKHTPKEKEKGLPRKESEIEKTQESIGERR